MINPDSNEGTQFVNLVVYLLNSAPKQRKFFTFSGVFFTFE